METTIEKKTGWIMFENGGVADFYALFFVGFTDKAGNPAAIGMFGSGFKLAIAAALRLGIEIVLYLGHEKVTAKTARRNVKGQDVDQLYFVRESADGSTEEHGTNLTLGYGAKDWKTAWGVFREMLANCRDADPRGYQVVYGVEPKGREGFTRVFIQATDDVMELYRNIDQYFKEERNAIFTCDNGRIYPKSSEDDQTNFYCKGMYVLTTQDTSLYDIDLYDMPINESRDASTANLLSHVLQLFDQTSPDIKIEIIRWVIEKGEEGVHTLESNLPWWRTGRPNFWTNAFRRAFPDHILCTFSEVEYQTIIRMGRKAVRATRGLYQLLSRNGIPTAQKILREEVQEKREVFEPEGILAENYNKAFTCVSKNLPELHRLQITFVKLPARERAASFITCSRGRGEYQFSENLLKSGPRSISIALIDALAQTKSASGKCDPRYEETLLQMILECVRN
jgi:hypothetical protein